MNKKTDCWKCGQTFGEPIVLGSIGNKIVTGKILIAYHEDDILCTECMDIEFLDG